MGGRVKKKKKQIIYRAGDILTACDNELDVPDGILGHSAIVVNQTHMIEAVIVKPYLRKMRIRNFTTNHKLRAVYRPKNPELGKAAAAYAISYLKQSKDYKQLGLQLPPFSFSPQLPLHDPWSSIYCSKLVWLCYHYGAKHSLPNDYLLFTPEDLDSYLRKDSQFKRLYRHPKFKFIVDS
jgi:hypothetical protein